MNGLRLLRKVLIDSSRSVRGRQAMMAATALALLILSEMADALCPVLAKRLIDDVKEASDALPINHLIFYYIMAKFLGKFLRDAQSLLISPLFYRVAYEQAARTSSQIVSRRGHHLLQTQSSEILGEQIATIGRMQIGIVQVLYSISGLYLPAVVSLLVTALVVQRLAGDDFLQIFIIGGIILYVSITFKRKEETGHAIRATAADIEVMGQIGGTLTKAALIQQYDAQDFFKQKLDRSVRVSLDTHQKLFQTKYKRSSATTMAISAMYGLSLLVAAQRVSSGSISIGTVFVVVLLLDRLLQPIAAISNANNSLVDGLVAIRSGYDLVDRINQNESVVSECRWTIAWTNDASQCDCKTKTVLVYPGNLLQISGKSGSGKTTLLADIYHDLLLQHAKQPFRILHLGSTPSLIDGTIFENICLGSLRWSKEEVGRVLDLWSNLCRNRFLKFEEDVSRLSLGERQFVALARAMLRDADVLILDEATNSIDVDAEALILKYLRERNPKQTMFLVTHRKVVSMRPDLIIQLDEHRSTLKGHACAAGIGRELSRVVTRR